MRPWLLSKHFLPEVSAAPLQGGKMSPPPNVTFLLWKTNPEKFNLVFHTVLNCPYLQLLSSNWKSNFLEPPFMLVFMCCTVLMGLYHCRTHWSICFSKCSLIAKLCPPEKCTEHTYVLLDITAMFLVCSLSYILCLFLEGYYWFLRVLFRYKYIIASKAIFSQTCRITSSWQCLCAQRCSLQSILGEFCPCTWGWMY